MDIDVSMILLLGNLLLLAWLGWRLRRLSRLGRLLGEELDSLRQQPHDAAPDLDRLLGSGERPLVVLDILNPMEVAARQSWFADKLGSLAPPLIRKIVFDETLKQVRAEVGKYGVRAQVWVHRGP